MFYPCFSKRSCLYSNLMPLGKSAFAVTSHKECCANIGVMGNADRRLIRWGKAGRMRKRGIKPTVKGKNMNPNDHPHGGGEGHSPIGQKRGPQSVYGKTVMGVRTRKPGKWSDVTVVQSRKTKKK